MFQIRWYCAINPIIIESWSSRTASGGDMFCFKKLKLNSSISEYTNNSPDVSDKDRESLIHNVSFHSGGSSSFSASSSISPLSNFTRALSLSSPQSIDRSHECLERVPTELMKTSNVQLKELNLSNNFLKSLPGHFYKLSRLVSLDLSDNQLVRLSSEIELLSNLENLDVSRILFN